MKTNGQDRCCMDLRECLKTTLPPANPRGHSHTQDGPKRTQVMAEREMQVAARWNQRASNMLVVFLLTSQRKPEREISAPRGQFAFEGEVCTLWLGMDRRFLGNFKKSTQWPSMMGWVGGSGHEPGTGKRNPVMEKSLFRQDES